MYKVIMADDYFLILDYLTSSIPWTELGLELVETCSNGKEALEACLRHQPHILITDIGMPLMNGLELIEEVRSSFPQMKTVILSCHEDFQYAQKAVKLHVGEYILKESLRIEQLIEVLRQLTQRLNEEVAAQKNYHVLQDAVKQHASAARTSFLHALLEQPVWNEAEWGKKAETIGIRCQDRIPYVPVLAVPDRAANLKIRFGGAQIMQFGIDNALSETIGTKDSILLTLDEKHYMILFPFSRTLKRNSHEDIRSDLRHIQQSMHRYMRIGMSFFIGDICEELRAIKKQTQGLLDAKTFRFYAGESRVIPIQHIETTAEDIFVHYSEALQDMRNCILSGNQADVVTTATDWVKRIEMRRYPVESVRSWVLYLITELELKYTVMQHFVSNFNAELLHRSIYAIDTLDHLKEWIIEFLMRKMESMQSLRDASVRKEIVEAKRYILTHLGEKISIEEIAKALNLTPTHFSRVFKKETGETFVEFVNRSKMERARELLDKSDLGVEQIAEQLGFDYTSYFIKLYRNFSGMSPMEYRRRI